MICTVQNGSSCPMAHMIGCCISSSSSGRELSIARASDQEAIAARCLNIAIAACGDNEEEWRRDVGVWHKHKAIDGGEGIERDHVILGKHRIEGWQCFDGNIELAIGDVGA